MKEISKRLLNICHEVYTVSLRYWTEYHMILIIAKKFEEAFFMLLDA
jgi:hypothetical protein